jgi:hypothetical protein
MEEVKCMHHFKDIQLFSFTAKFQDNINRRSTKTKTENNIQEIRYIYIIISISFMKTKNNINKISVMYCS